ncbi:pentapeptide repeat-containing protein [Streptomyces sp. NBC_00140]|uniref:pentapeptide repeat-containing protein n=1 Tax=Streptomyces sp. NBC_00140 TaxID=2975664 RepID=UPI002253A89A|nr:pentapeptide repeat-containing protein [Streptomyces sp. NBC_00140]MCX5338246.1 pentapeptide repeat-containing protein [Streptomyces sp. NBC_00140]
MAAVTWLLWRGWPGSVWRALVPMARPGWDNLPAEVRTTAEAQFRLAVIQATIAVGASVALVYTVRNYRLTRRGQVTDRFTKALERLGSSEMYIRIGGILALEQIVQDARDQAPHAAQILNAFLRDRAPQRPQTKVCETSRVAARWWRAARRTALPTATSLPVRPQSDVQAALTALSRPASRRHVDPAQHIGLSGLHLQLAELSGADLSGAKLVCADLSEAFLADADLSWANLAGANLSSAQLCGADLSFAQLFGADLSAADLSGADLTRADLTGADLRNVNCLRPEQLLRARVGLVKNLPTELAADPAVAARVAADTQRDAEIQTALEGGG